MGEKSRKPRRGSLFPFFFFKKKKKRDRRKFVSDSNRKGGREVSLLFTIRSQFNRSCLRRNNAATLKIATLLIPSSSLFSSILSRLRETEGGEDFSIGYTRTHGMERVNS